MKSEAFGNDIYVYQAMASHNFLNANQFLKLLQNVTELRSPSAEKAGYYLDSALTARSTNMAADVSGRDSHFIFTLHVYLYIARDHSLVGIIM